LPEESFCVHCGAPLVAGNEFCPKCGKSATAQTQGTKVTQAGSPMSQKVGGIPVWLIVIGLIIIVLIVPVIPVHKTIMVAGTTQTVTQSTSYSTAYQTVVTTTPTQLDVYTGSISWVSDQYYNYYNSYYPGYYSGCYYDQYGNYYCNYTGWYNYQSYTGSATIDPSDRVVNVQTTNEANGLISLVLTHYDGTQDTYRHVISDDLTRGGVVTVTTTSTMTNTMTNSIVTPVTNTIPCNACVPQDTVYYTSILGLLLGY